MNRRRCDNCKRTRSSIVPLARGWANRGKRICWECFNATLEERERRREEGAELAAVEAAAAAKRQRIRKHQALNRQIWEGKPHGPIPDVDGQETMAFDKLEPEVAVPPRSEM